MLPLMHDGAACLRETASALSAVDVDGGADGKGMNAMERAVNRPILCPKIIGRTPEFAALGSLVEQAKQGQGYIAQIAGEAGIGKSRLVSELKTTAVAQGF